MIQFDVVGFGALNVDKLYRVNKIANAEEESWISAFTETCGGSAANAIVGLARLRCNVGFIGKVAGDTEGRMLLEDFRKEGVDTTNIILAKKGRSGKTLGFVDRKGSRALYVDPGVNDTIKLDEISIENAFRTKFMHLTSFVGEESFQTQKKIVDLLPRRVKLSLDPGEFYARKGAALKTMLNRALVVLPNAKELELLTGVANYERGAEILLEYGVKTVAVKLGSEGCYVTDGEESHLIEPFKVKVMDTTGAGDGFCAGFLYGLVSGKSLYECGRIGNFVASRKISRSGARNGLPRLEDLGLLE